VVVVDDWSFPAPRTKDAVAALAALELTGRILVVLGPDDGIPDRSFANLREVQTMQGTELNAYDVLKSDFVVFSDATLPGETTPAPDKAAAPRKARPPTPKSKATDTEEADTEEADTDETVTDETVTDEAVTDEAVTAVADEGSGTDEDGSDR
jgi:large subunit ribosomal protein L4